MWTSNRIQRSRLTVLAGFLVIASTIGAAGPEPTTALTISPAAHNFGQVIVGAAGTVFQFAITLPPGGAPDSVVVTVTGPDAGNFLVGTMTAPVATGTRPITTCTTPAWRTGSCTVGVEFVPLSPGVKNATLTVSDTRGNSGTATLTGTGVFGCVMYEGLCNYAASYYGSFGWRSTLHGTGGTWTKNVDVSIGVGGVLCSGTESEPDVGGGQRTGAVSGPGLLVVEFKRIEGELKYLITAACPPAFGGRPANFSRRESMDPEPASKIGIEYLQGTQSGPHADADPGSGATGTQTYAWELFKRN